MNPVLIALSRAAVITAATAAPALSLSAQPVAVQDETAPAAAPRIQFEPAKVDFGTIDDSAIITKTVTMTNVGDATLVIPEDGVKGSCGCTVPSLPKYTLEPGESIEMSVAFDPRNRSGAQPKTVTVHANTGTPTMLPVDAFVVQRIQFVENMVSFSSVDQGEAHTQTIRVRGLAPDFKVTEASVTRGDIFAARVLDTTTVERAHPVTGEVEMVGETTIEITLLESAPVGRHDSSLKISTNDEISKQHETRITASINGDLRMDPVNIRLGALAPGSTFEHTVNVYSNRGESFDISRTVFVTSDLSEEDKKKIEITHEPIPEDDGRTGYRVTISGEVSPTMRLVRGKLVMVTNAPGQRILSAMVVGVVRAQQG